MNTWWALCCLPLLQFWPGFHSCPSSSRGFYSTKLSVGAFKSHGFWLEAKEADSVLLFCFLEVQEETISPAKSCGVLAREVGEFWFKYNLQSRGFRQVCNMIKIKLQLAKWFSCSFQHDQAAVFNTSMALESSYPNPAVTTTPNTSTPWLADPTNSPLNINPENSNVSYVLTFVIPQQQWNVEKKLRWNRRLYMHEWNVLSRKGKWTCENCTR
jgi:hypothetical protein